MQEFKRFQELFISKEVKTTKKYNDSIEKEALDWFKKEFGATFGTTTRCDTKNFITWHYSTGLLMFGIPKIGSYHYKFIIMMIHFQYWKVKEWEEGYLYGQYCGKSKMKVRNNNYRDANPYTENNFYHNKAWDAGYMMGLSNFLFNNIN
jgi:hypothetical protein